MFMRLSLFAKFDLQGFNAIAGLRLTVPQKVQKFSDLACINASTCHNSQPYGARFRVGNFVL